MTLNSEIDVLSNYLMELYEVKHLYMSNMKSLLLDENIRKKIILQAAKLFRTISESHLLPLDSHVKRRLDEFTKYTPEDIVAVNKQEFLMSIIQLVPILMDIIRIALRARNVGESSLFN